METLLVNLSMEVFGNKHSINSVMIDTCTMGFKFDLIAMIPLPKIMSQVMAAGILKENIDG